MEYLSENKCWCVLVIQYTSMDKDINVITYEKCRGVINMMD